MDKDQINKALFAFLQTIYKFEQKELDEFSISWQEMLLLKHLTINSEMNMGAVTNILSIKPFQATRLVDGLEKKRFIARSDKEHDRRVKSIHITTEGKARMAAIDDFHHVVIERAAKELGDNRAEEILMMMFQLDQLLGLSQK